MMKMKPEQNKTSWATENIFYENDPSSPNPIDLFNPFMQPPIGSTGHYASGLNMKSIHSSYEISP